VDKSIVSPERYSSGERGKKAAERSSEGNCPGWRLKLGADVFFTFTSAGVFSVLHELCLRNGKPPTYQHNPEVQVSMDPKSLLLDCFSTTKKNRKE